MPGPTESVAAPERKPPLPGLTGVRTFLALGIMFFHFTPPHASLIRPVIEAGFTYISFFLLISGFVLAYNYAHRAHTLQPGRFYAARLSRLYPVYLLSLIVSLAMLHAEWLSRSHPEFWRGFLLTPFLLQGWSPTLATFWNTVAWTLATEAMLYLAFPYLIRMKWWPSEPKKLLLLFAGFWLWELLLPGIYILLNPDGLHNIDRYSSAYWLRALKYTPLPFLPIFLAGITLGRLHGAVELTDRTKMWLALTSITTVLCVFYFAVPHLPYVLLHGGLITPLFAALVFGLTGKHWISARTLMGAHRRVWPCQPVPVPAAFQYMDCIARVPRAGAVACYPVRPMVFVCLGYAGLCLLRVPACRAARATVSADALCVQSRPARAGVRTAWLAAQRQSCACARKQGRSAS